MDREYIILTPDRGQTGLTLLGGGERSHLLLIGPTGLSKKILFFLRKVGPTGPTLMILHLQGSGTHSSVFWAWTHLDPLDQFWTHTGGNRMGRPRRLRARIHSFMGLAGALPAGGLCESVCFL